MREREHIEHWAIIIIVAISCVALTIMVILKAGQHSKATREKWHKLWTQSDDKNDDH
jgi:hypothetical protein